MAAIRSYSRLIIGRTGTLVDKMLFTNSTATITGGTAAANYSAAYNSSQMISNVGEKPVMFFNGPSEALLIVDSGYIILEFRFGKESFFLTANVTTSTAVTGCNLWYADRSAKTGTPTYSVAAAALNQTTFDLSLNIFQEFMANCVSSGMQDVATKIRIKA